MITIQQEEIVQTEDKSSSASQWIKHYRIERSDRRAKMINLTDVWNGSSSVTDHEEMLYFPYSSYSNGVNVLLIVILTVMISWTVMGNLTVIIAVKRSKSLRSSPSNVLVANLALSDLLLALMVLPFSAMVEVSGYWPIPKGLCFFWLIIGNSILYYIVKQNYNYSKRNNTFLCLGSTGSILFP